MADVSVRESIQWKPAPPSEPTSTVVLTSPRKHFVDVRILLPLDPSGILTPARLDWAFAGTSTTSEACGRDGEGRLVTAAAWTHWVDSRDPRPDAPGGPADRAEVRVAPDGRAVEVGSMVDPATGRETEYVEVWVPGEVGGGEVVVLRTERRGEDEGERGVVVRVGRWVQGVLRVGKAVCVGRWERGGDGWWRVVARMGEALDDVLGWVTEGKKGEQRLEVGGKVVEAEGRVWDVVELVGDVDGVMP